MSSLQLQLNQDKVNLKRFPRGITNLPCWSQLSPNIPDAVLSSGFYDSVSIHDREDLISCLTVSNVFLKQNEGILDSGWSPDETQIRFQSLSFYQMSISGLPAKFSQLTGLRHLCLKGNKVFSYYRRGLVCLKSLFIWLRSQLSLIVIANQNARGYFWDYVSRNSGCIEKHG